MNYSTPEREGISSRVIEKYVRAIYAERLYMHSIIVARHGSIIFEAYYKPMDESFIHRLYSCSKSFTSVAIGVLCAKGLIALDDPIMKYFPERNAEGYLAETTIRDLLRMSSAYTKGANYSAADPVWEDTFFNDTVSHVPGAVFSYCTSGTTILCDIIRRVTGENFMSVLRPAFDEIGVSKDAFCVEAPDGFEWGGSGVCMTARDFAKFANLVMRYGNHEGRQILPEDYLMEATSRQIDNSLYASNNDNESGYGYQFWMLPNNGFAFYGMGGQYAICLPEKDLLIVTTGYEELKKEGRLEIFRALWREIYPNISDTPLPDDEEALNSLKAFADTMELEHARGAANSPIARFVSGKKYIMTENTMGIKWVCFNFEGDKGVWEYENESGAHALEFGICKNVKTRFPERYSGRRIGTLMDEGYVCYNSAAWRMPDTLMMHINATDIYLGQLRIAVNFKNDTVTLHGIKHAEWFMNNYEGFASGKME